MDKIIIFVLFSTIGLIPKGNAEENAQLHCFVCNNCPDVSVLDSNVIQNCDLVLNPGDPDTTLDDGTTWDISVTTEIIDGTSTQTIPDAPPSVTTQQPTAPPFSLGHKYKDVIRQLVGSHQCFVVERQVGESFEVNRGCVATRESETETCSVANFGQNPLYCRLCNTNECNHAAKYTISFLIILSSLSVVLLNY